MILGSMLMFVGGLISGTLIRFYSAYRRGFKHGLETGLNHAKLCVSELEKHQTLDAEDAIVRLRVNYPPGR